MAEDGWVRDPAAFNAKAYAQATARAHATGPDLFQITVESHPTLFETFELISHDSGGSAGHESYSVPVDLREQAQRVEAILGRLTADELSTVAAGDQDDAAEILSRRCTNLTEIDEVETMLNGIFEDWPSDETESDAETPAE